MDILNTVLSAAALARDDEVKPFMMNFRLHIARQVICFISDWNAISNDVC
jgi:hypothetical protein